MSRRSKVTSAWHSSPQGWVRPSQSLTRDLQHVFCSPPALGTHQSHQTSSLCGLANIWRASCLIVVVALILLVWLVLSSQGSTYRQWPMGLVRPWRVFKHVESTRVEWPWHWDSTNSWTSNWKMNQWFFCPIIAEAMLNKIIVDVALNIYQREGKRNWLEIWDRGETHTVAGGFLPTIEWVKGG